MKKINALWMLHDFLEGDGEYIAEEMGEKFKGYNHYSLDAPT